jgi:hypothetical protein
MPGRSKRDQARFIPAVLALLTVIVIVAVVSILLPPKYTD